MGMAVTYDGIGNAVASFRSGGKYTYGILGIGYNHKMKKNISELFHETPSRWIIKRRLEEAYTLLKQENAAPSEIYLKVGFKNFSHFSTAFKKQFGISPSVIWK